MIMGLYDNVLLPKLCDLAMRNKHLKPYRERVLAAATGRVLEVGAGSGLNLALYKPTVSEVLALEPAPKLILMAEARARAAMRPVRFIEASAEAIPLEDNSIDTVVTTWTLCTIPDPVQAMQEMRRVLRPGGRLLFVEHGLAPEPRIQKWQNRLTPMWRHVSGGCHLNRPIADTIAQAGYRFERLETSYLPGPKIMGFLTEGSATPY
jgi:ubiquinone/menaquinone biosynthesis C-methylase UbiE